MLEPAVPSPPRTWLLGLVALVCLFTTACAHRSHASTPVTQNRELESFATAAAFPNAEDAVVLLAVQQYMTAHREDEGYTRFHDLAIAQPERPILRSAEGLLQLRIAHDIPLARRIAWVEDAVDDLDAAAARSPLLGRFVRGLGLAALPARFDAADTAIADLEASLARRDEFPFDPDRGIYTTLARLYADAGRDTLAAEMRERGGSTGREGGAQILGNASVDRRAGYRFCEPRFVREAEGVYVAEGYDMSNIAFLVDPTGIVAIDAGATEAGARAALAALREVSDAPIRTVVLTHAHWDHIGGLRVLRGPDTKVIGSKVFADELARVRAFHAPYTWFFGSAPSSFDVTLDHAVAESETLRQGELELRVFPAASGETPDALYVELSRAGILFVGDAFMPYVGAPFAGEGSPEGYLAAIAEVRRLAPRRLVHGHPPLTRYFTVEAMPGLELALRSTYARVRAAADRARPIAEVLHDDLVPASLREHPAAVQPFVVVRDNFIGQVMHHHGGRWFAGGTGVHEVDRSEWAAVLDALTESRPRRFVRTIDRLLARGDAPLAFELANAAMQRHPHDRALASARARAAVQLRERYQQVNPFRFIVVSELADQPLPPTRPPRRTTAPPAGLAGR